jgi:molybdate transport system ATP-binding protein
MLINLADITIQIGSGNAFAHTRWAIEKNQHWAIFGPTGAGKSLLVAAIERKVLLVGGQIYFYFDPNEPNGRPYIMPHEVVTLSAETHSAFLTRYAAYHQARWQSTEGEDVPNVAKLLNDSAAGSKRPGTDPASVIAMLKIEGLLQRGIHQLSHGESRKVHIARLLLQAPHLLILDDPFVGLDQEARGLMRHAMDVLLAQADPQILILSSRVEEIPQSVDRVLVVQDLRVVAEVSRDELPEVAVRLEAEAKRLPQAGGVQRANAFEKMAEQYAHRLARSGVMASALVEMRNVSVTYGTVAVLREIDWRVGQGERWALSGHNGAGKTTLLSLILADNPQAYANEIHLFGRRRGSGESIWEIKQHIGWVSPELHIHYPRAITCREVVSSGFFDSVGLYQRCTPEQLNIADGWMAALGMDALADTQFQAISTGQQRMALLARAMVKEPPLLILDEPCQGLDDTHRRAFTRLLDEVCAHTAVAMVYVTHYQDELPAAITHRLVLGQGRIVEKGVVVAL